MKLHGKKLTSPAIEYCVLPRPDGDLVFRASAILDYSEFENLVTSPTPPMRVKPGGVREPHFQDPTYLQQVTSKAELRMHYLVVKSLEGSPGLEWETVDLSNPKTWGNYKAELEAAFLNPQEITRIENACFTANGLNEAAVQQARENFLRGMEAELGESSGQGTEPKSTPSGDPANG